LGPTHTISKYFEEAEGLLHGEDPCAPLPFRTFASDSSAFHLTRNPSFKRMTIDEAAEKFHLPNLRAALADYLQQVLERGTHVELIGGHRVATSYQLPFDWLEIWTSVQIQTTAYHDPSTVTPPMTVDALPPSKQWPLGKCDTVLVNTDPDKRWPHSGMTGMPYSHF
jgi:hypothetical protein